MTPLLRKLQMTARFRKRTPSPDQQVLWEMPLERAITFKHQEGREAHRHLDPNADFVGDPLLELFEELLDSINYLRVYRRRTGESWAKDMENLLFGFALTVRRKLQERIGR
jgi:hypothetical protein